MKKCVKMSVSDFMSREKEHHQNSFKRVFDLSRFTFDLERYGSEKINQWREELGLEPAFLPPVDIRQFPELEQSLLSRQFLSWIEHHYISIKSGLNFYSNQNGRATTLPGVSVLIDTWDNSCDRDVLCGQIIKRLRTNNGFLKRKQRIAPYKDGYEASRRCVSAEEWNIIKPFLMQKALPKVRLERLIEALIFPRLYPYLSQRNNGGDKIWTWQEEFFKDKGERIYSGVPMAGIPDIGHLP